ncbi:hypothetical protein MABM_17520 [Mycobacteroides abscessus]|nr:hypothetical protein MABM_17520 [Mycobacteroides abscessus]
MNYKESFIRECVKNPRESSRTFAPGTGEQGNRGIGEQDDEARDRAVEVVPPEYIDNPSKPATRHASDASKAVVRQVLGSRYPRTTVDRLGIQVQKLAREGHPDKLIRESLAEWERRPNCDKPEFLPTVLGDLVKASRTEQRPPPATRKVGIGLDLAAKFAQTDQTALEAG